VTAVFLDTHAFLWFVFDDPRLSAAAARTIEDTAVTKLLSVISLWEITIKRQVGKLQLGMELDAFFEEHVTSRELELVDLELSHLLAYDALPLIHRDPFDRLLLAQAKVMDVPIVTIDPQFAEYEARVIW